MKECRSQSVNIKLCFLLVSYCTNNMLILNIILFTSGICFATNVVPSTRASIASTTSTKSKRIVADSDHNIRNNQEQSRDTQAAPVIPQNINLRSSPHYENFKSTDTQQVPYTSTNQGSDSHAYGIVPKRPLPYVSFPNYHIKSEQSRNNPLAPYLGVLNNLDVSKTVRNIERPTNMPKSIISPTVQKLQGTYSPSYNIFHQERPTELSGFSNFEHPSYGINKFISPGVLNEASSAIIQAPLYKMSYPVSQITDYSQVPSVPTMSSIIPSPDKTNQNLKQKEKATIDVNGKKISVPIIQLQSNLDLSEVFPAFESQPFLLSENYPIESNMGFKLETGPKYNIALQSNNVSPFSSPLSSFQGHIVPIQTTSGNPQFPLYKGASIETHPVASNIPKTQTNYESFYNQPQLHFGNVYPTNIQKDTGNPSTQGILNDAEIINKKNPEPHTPQLDDDNDNEEEDKKYKNQDKEYDHSLEDDKSERQAGKYFKAPPIEKDFKPSTSYPFKEYDEKFGKHRVQFDDDDLEDKSYYKKYSSNEEEEDSLSEHRSEYAKPSHDSYEEDEEEEKEESRKQEKHNESNEDSYEVKPGPYKYYQKDFEQEFEDSYKEELPKQEYVHVKEVPEIDSYIKPTSKRQQRKEEQSKESKNSQKGRKIPTIDYKDSTAYGSDISVKKTGKTIYEEFFGYEKPEIDKYLKHPKTQKFSFIRKLSEENNYPYIDKYHKLKSYKSGSKFIPKEKDPYFSTNNKKLIKNSSDKTIIGSNIKQLSDFGDEASLYGSSALNNQMHSFTNTQILRDLTGI